MLEGKFPLGRLVMTTNLERTMLASDPEGWREELTLFVSQHAMGEWGEMPPEDVEANDAALGEGGRLMSAYTTSKSIKFWIITEADRSVTTCLLPEDY